MTHLCMMNQCSMINTDDTYVCTFFSYSRPYPTIGRFLWSQNWVSEYSHNSTNDALSSWIMILKEMFFYLLSYNSKNCLVKFVWIAPKSERRKAKHECIVCGLAVSFSVYISRILKSILLLWFLFSEQTTVSHFFIIYFDFQTLCNWFFHCLQSTNQVTCNTISLRAYTH